MEHSRKKSCKECRYAKTRCDLKARCARCEKKGFACTYEQPTWASMPAAPDPNELFRTWLVETNTTEPDVSGKASHFQEAAGMTATPGQPHRKIHAVPVYEDSQEDLTRRGAARPSAATRDANDQTLNGVPDPVLAMPDAHDACTFGPIPGCSNEELLEKMNAQNALLQRALQEDANMIGTVAPEPETSMMEITSSLGHWKTMDSVSEMLPNILNRKKVNKVWELTNANNIWSQIKTYPMEFCKGRLPPFIHRSSLPGRSQSTTTEFNLSEALANFDGIAGMYFKKTSACHNIVLNAMFHEVNALNDEVRVLGESRLQLVQALADFA